MSDDIDYVVECIKSINLYTDEDYKFVGEVVTLCDKEKTFHGDTVESLMWDVRRWLFEK